VLADLQALEHWRKRIFSVMAEADVSTTKAAGLPLGITQLQHDTGTL
jgi:hypothetical protein